MHTPDAASPDSRFEQMKADLHHELRHRRRLCRVLTFGRHLYGKPWRVDVGPVNFEESEDTLMGWFRQCRICREVEDA